MAQVASRSMLNSIADDRPQEEIDPEERMHADTIQLLQTAADSWQPWLGGRLTVLTLDVFFSESKYQSNNHLVQK